MIAGKGKGGAMFYIIFIIMILSGIALTVILFSFTDFLKKTNFEVFASLGHPDASYFLIGRWFINPKFLGFLLGWSVGKNTIQEFSAFPKLALLRVLTFLHVGSWLVGFVVSTGGFWRH